MSNFSDKVYAVVKSIPSGKTLSYQEVAKKAGSAKAYRAVASLMSKNFDPAIPCHRVILSNGKLGNYNRGGQAAKHAILKSEGYHSNRELHGKQH